MDRRAFLGAASTAAVAASLTGCASGAASTASSASAIRLVSTMYLRMR